MKKLWDKAQAWQFGDTLVEWRHRDTSKFFSKIFSWLLGAFVFGLLTSIFFAAIGLPDASLPLARLVFFVVFIMGVVSNLFRAVINGFHYAITQQALVYEHPLFGWEGLGKLLGSDNKPFRQRFYFIKWQNVREIREQAPGFLLVLKNEHEIFVPVEPVLKLAVNLNLSQPEAKSRHMKKDEKAAYDKEARKMILQAARDARRSAQGA